MQNLCVRRKKENLKPLKKNEFAKLRALRTTYVYIEYSLISHCTNFIIFKIPLFLGLK